MNTPRTTDDFALRLLEESMHAVNGQGEIKIFLIAIIPIKCTLGDARMGSDVVHAHLMVAMLGE